MTEYAALAGLDDIDWSALSHAYGSAEDLPDLLRRLASAGSEASSGHSADATEADLDDDDAEAADDAEEILGDLWATICHQGSVYSATVAAVPFLAEIAAAGIETTPVLYLLGSIAEAADPREIGDASLVRAAVAACFDLLAPHLESPDVDVRAAVIFVLAHSGPTERVRPLLVALWSAGADSVMRANLLQALIRVDSGLAADLAGEVLDSSSEDDSSDASLRVSAAFTWIHAGRALNERVLTAALAPVPEDGQDLSNWCAGGELFDLIVNEVTEHHGVRAAAEFLARALVEAQGGPDSVTEQRLEAAQNLVLAYRGAAESLIGPITGFLGNPELKGPVFRLLTTIGPAAFSPRVREHLIELSQGSDAFADDALSCLFSFGDPIVPTLLAHHLADRPRTLNIVSGATVGSEPGHLAVPFDAELIAAIRRRLAELADTAGREAPKDESLFAGMRRNNEPIQLAHILGAWGEAAAPAAAELARILPISTIPAARALAAMAPRAPESEDDAHALAEVSGGKGSVREEGDGSVSRVIAQPEESGRPGDLSGPIALAVGALREIFGQADVAATARIAVAEAIRALTGDSEPLLDVVLSSLSRFSGPDNPADSHRGDDELRAAAKAAADLPAHAAILVPRLTEALLDAPPPGPSLPAHNSRIQLVSTLYRLTGDSASAIPALRESLALAGELYTGWTVAGAADAAAALGSGARSLLPAIESALEEPVACAAAARALLMIDPDGEWANGKREQLADYLIRTLTHSRAHRAQQRALDVLDTLGPALPPAAVEALRELADGDERILAALPNAELVRADEEARARIRALLNRLA